MFLETFHQSLTSARKQQRLSLRSLHSKSGIHFNRLWRLERGVSLPSPEERRELSRILADRRGNLRFTDSRPPGFFGELSAAGANYRGETQVFLPPRDRTSRQRYIAATYKYADEMRRLTEAIEAREDFCLVNCFCELLSLGSTLECLFVSTLLARGAGVGFVEPFSLGSWLPNRIVCPFSKRDTGHLSYPVLLTAEAALFPQVSFLTPRLWTVDLLRHNSDKWDVIEIDGPGHSFETDYKKASDIKLPHQRLTETDILGMARQCA